jgi:hypothetical protein
MSSTTRERLSAVRIRRERMQEEAAQEQPLSCELPGGTGSGLSNEEELAMQILECDVSRESASSTPEVDIPTTRPKASSPVVIMCTRAPEPEETETIFPFDNIIYLTT